MGQVLTMGYIYSFNPYNNILKGNDYSHFIDKKMELKKKKHQKTKCTRSHSYWVEWGLELSLSNTKT